MYKISFRGQKKMKSTFEERAPIKATRTLYHSLSILFFSSFLKSWREGDVDLQNWRSD